LDCGAVLSLSLTFLLGCGAVLFLSFLSTIQ
jgi:hypothetical protein